MDFEPCFMVYDLYSVHPKSIKLRQMTSLNMIFHAVASLNPNDEVVPEKQLFRRWHQNSGITFEIKYAKICTGSSNKRETSFLAVLCSENAFRYNPSGTFRDTTVKQVRNSSLGAL